jgi:UDP-N-acetylmuramoylalanine--D-glutamate ligase
MRIEELAGKRVAIWGMGREGRAALGVLRRRLANQRLTIFCSDAEARVLERMVPAQESLPQGLSAPSRGSGGSRDALAIVREPPDSAALSAFDVVIKSPGISAYRAEIAAAGRNGTRFTSGTALWFAERTAARVIAVTGTKGKSTTAALIAHLLRGLGRRVALVGNIGLPLLELLDAPEPDWWVMELSSFQTREAGMVDIGVITQLAEEHLDWHGSRERYVEDKLALADRARCLIVHAGQVELMARTASHARRLTFADDEGWNFRGRSLRRGAEACIETANLPLPGAHNAINACAALTALEAAGEDARAALPHLASFQPLPHRLQTLGERDGLTWIDDSIATTPHATLEALASVAGREVCLLLGGHDRGLDWSGFVRAVRERIGIHAGNIASSAASANASRSRGSAASRQVPASLAIVTMGAVGRRVSALFDPDADATPGTNACRVHWAGSLSDAVTRARALLKPGGVVLLSPGAPSFDEFRDYAERGRTFAALAGFDAAASGEIPGLGIS